MNLVFMTYNNYYNRIIKKEDTMAAYDSIASNSQEFYDIQFNPNDGVFTEQIVNWRNNNWTPDYLVVYDDTAQPNVAIQSRWFVLEWVRTRTGQYKATLYRDSIADNYDTVVQSPMFIEKATVPFESDVAIYNTEDMQTNQIKTNEVMLKDRTESAWLVGYFAKNITGTIDRHIVIPGPKINAINVNTLDAWPFYKYTVGRGYYKLINNFDIIMKCRLLPPIATYTTSYCTIDTAGSASVAEGYNAGYVAYTNNVPTNATQRIQWVKENLVPSIVSLKTTFQNYIVSDEDYHTIDTITELDGKWLYVENTSQYGEAGYYKISVSTPTIMNDNETYSRGSSTEADFNNYMNNVNDRWLIASSGLLKANVSKRINYNRYQITLTKQNTDAAYLDFPVSPRTLEDAPYGMFCMPANKLLITKYSTETQSEIPYLHTPELEEATAYVTAIAESLGANCYDTQLVPYFPLIEDGIVTADNTISVTNLSENTDYVFIKTDLGNNVIIDKSVLFFASKAKFKTEILENLSIPRYVFDDVDDTLIEDYKISNQCDSYRLCSPNWAAFADFNLVRAGGSISKFNIDCHYKPYMPYIHIEPNWRGLYNQAYKDYRGLICQGDFAIPMINDQWKQFMINNKNYLNSFNRQIDSIELQNSIQKTKDVISAVSGTFTGTAAGAVAGSKYGPYGAIAGAAVGGITAGIGGALDVQYNEMLRNDALDLTKDQFGYNLQNIQARPDTLAKVSSFDNNNRIWPVLEYYTCTNQEKEALVNKMRYNGMTIMRIGKILEFINDNPQYIKGKLIRNTSIVDDYHVLTTIAQELDKGVFI